jgi:hypothetical protein
MPAAYTLGSRWLDAMSKIHFFRCVPMFRRKSLPVVVWMWILFVSLPLLAEPPAPQADEAKPPPKPTFVRVQRDADGEPLALETVIVTFTKADSKEVTVDLIGAVHIGDKSYYDELNKIFASYDVLLYELVAPEGTRIPKGGRGAGSGHPISAMQSGMKSMLGLEFQLECIDYTKENFVHADMSPDEFAKSMKDRGESFFQMFLRMMGQGMAEQAKPGGGSSDVNILLALFAKDRELRLKRIMAEQFEDLEGSMAALEGEDGSTIITERNKKAFEVLQREITAGKKRIGVFYGAGHLPDMQQRLIADFGLQPSSHRWLSAWSLQPVKPPAEDKDKANE